MSDIVKRIQDNYDFFTKTQKVVAEYVRNNLEDLAFETLDEIAGKIGVSTTTVIRFARVLQFKGYSGLQASVRNQLLYRQTLPERLDNINIETVKKDELINIVFQNDTLNLKKTLEGISYETLKNVISIINSANNVIIFGLRGAHSLAHFMTIALSEVRNNVRLIHGLGYLYPEEVNGIKEGDVCVTFAFPRYLRMSTDLIYWIKKRGAKVILITDANHFELEKKVDILLPCHIKGASFKYSLTAPMALVNYIVAAVAAVDKDRSKKVLHLTEEILDQGYFSVL